MGTSGTEVGAPLKGNIVYEILKNQILSFELKPGEKLSENNLAAQMNTGRVQVREALARLVEEGYIVVYPQKGTEVALIDRSRVQQAVYTHIVLDQAVIRELCQINLSPDQFQLMEETISGADSEKDHDVVFDYLVTEQQLNYLFASFSGREHIWNIFRTLDCDLLRVRYLLYRTYGSGGGISTISLSSYERAQVESRLMVDNIRRGEAEVACLLCENHFNAILGSTDTLRSIYPQYFA